MKKLALIAGSGRFPVQIAAAAQKQGWEIVLFVVAGETNTADYDNLVSKSIVISVGQLDKLIENIHSENIVDVVMAGKVHKHDILNGSKPDARFLKQFLSLKDHADDTLLVALANEFSSEGITLHPTAFCLKELLAGEGTLTLKSPTPEQWKDIAYGWRIAKELGRLDIGQTVVVKSRSIMALEAIEGTDEAILRGGKLAGSGAVVVKVAKPQQDTRLDMPTVGIKTIKSMHEANADALAIEAGWTVLLDRGEVIAMAEEYGITIVSCVIPPEGKTD